MPAISRRTSWRPLAVFAVLSAALVPPSFSGAADRLLAEPFARLLATQASGVARVFAAQVEADGDLLRLPGVAGTLWVSPGCAAIPAYATLIALELAAARRVRAGALRAVAACGAFFLLNLGRILSLVALKLHRPELFATVHEVGWNAALFVLVTGYVVLRLLRASEVRAPEPSRSEPPPS